MQVCGDKQMHEIVERKIRQAFPAESLPRDWSDLVSGRSAAYLHNTLCGRRWDCIGSEEYRFCGDGISLLPIPLLHYYLPGFLLAGLESTDDAGVLAEYWTYALSGESDADWQRMQLLANRVTVEQIDAVALWLAYYGELYGMNPYVRRCFDTLETWAEYALHPERCKSNASEPQFNPV